MAYETQFLPLKVDIDKFVQLPKQSSVCVTITAIDAVGLEMLDLTVPGELVHGQIIKLDIESKAWRTEIRLMVFIDLKGTLCGASNMVLTPDDFKRVDERVKYGGRALVCVLYSVQPEPDSEEQKRLVAEETERRAELVKKRQDLFLEKQRKRILKKVDAKKKEDSVNDQV